MFLGIDSDNARILEGTSPSSGRVLSAIPAISLCKLTTDKGDLSEGAELSNPVEKIYFREDFYDPRSRLRRGRLYKACDQFNMSWFVVGIGATRHIDTYSNYSVWSYGQQKEKRDLYVLLGDKKRFTRWRIVDVEVMYTGEELITLKALTTFGLLPELLENEIPPENLSAIKKNLQQLVDDMYGASADSTVDNCRETASAIISAFVGQPATDLADLIKLLRESQFQKRVAANGAEIINTFHPRRKISESSRRGLRAITDEDAQFSVLAIGLILVELGWGRW